jgi:hypothetical protein
VWTMPDFQVSLKGKAICSAMLSPFLLVVFHIYWGPKVCHSADNKP